MLWVSVYTSDFAPLCVFFTAGGEVWWLGSRVPESVSTELTSSGQWKKAIFHKISQVKCWWHLWMDVWILFGGGLMGLSTRI